MRRMLALLPLTLLLAQAVALPNSSYWDTVPYFVHCGNHRGVSLYAQDNCLITSRLLRLRLRLRLICLPVLSCTTCSTLP